MNCNRCGCGDDGVGGGVVIAQQTGLTKGRLQRQWMLMLSLVGNMPAFGRALTADDLIKASVVLLSASFVGNDRL
eukprot:1160450-Pelagomonas_calceolata.AAC.13